MAKGQTSSKIRVASNEWAKPSMSVQKPMVLDTGKWANRSPRQGWTTVKPLPKDMRPGKTNPKTGRPLGGLIVYPAIDPYTVQQRMMFRAIMTKLTWVLRANVIIQKLVCGQSYTTSVEMRKDESVKQSEIEAWRKQKIKIPYFNEEWTPEQVKAWLDKLADKLDAESIWFNAYLYQREQGRCAIGMFPEVRDPETEMYQLPETLRIIRPEYTRRPLMNRDNGALEAVEVVGLTTNGGRLDANRCVYFQNAYNLDLFSDNYGRSVIDPVEDIGKALLTIYAQDFPQAAQYTWFKPTVWKITVPARDYQNPTGVLDQFLAKRNMSLGRDIATTNTVEPIFAPANSGDIAGVVAIENECIDAIAGFYNIPPFMLAKGKAGRLGGNANREEIESFLETEIRPEQIILESVIETQFYDRILAILFNIEPDDVSNPELCPIRMRMHFNKPEIDLTMDPTQYKIYKDLVSQGILDMDGFIEKLGLRKLIKRHETAGEPKDPTIDTWKKINPTWQRRLLPTGALKGKGKEWKPTPMIDPVWDGGQGWPPITKDKSQNKWNFEDAT